MNNFTRAFDENFHMDHAMFELLYSKVAKYLQPKRATRIDTKSPRQRLAIALEYVVLKKTPGSGSEYFNSNRYHSIILMALVDANYRFISIDVGAKGSEGDANIFSRSELGRMIKSDDPNLNGK